jgi:hypothetical protein
VINTWKSKEDLKPYLKKYKNLIIVKSANHDGYYLKYKATIDDLVNFFNNLLRTGTIKSYELPRILNFNLKKYGMIDSYEEVMKAIKGK